MRAREGEPNPQGCGIPLRSGRPFLHDAPAHQTLPACSPEQSRTLSRSAPAKRRTIANSAGKACLKSKVCEPWKASPVRRDAGSLCDQAGLSCTTHRLTRSPAHQTLPVCSPEQTARMQDPFAIRQAFPPQRTSPQLPHPEPANPPDKTAPPHPPPAATATPADPARPSPPAHPMW